MTPTIAILICCRRRGNHNSNLPRLLESLTLHTFNPEAVQLLVKFDTDDWCAPSLIRMLNRSPLQTGWLQGPRGRGYVDIHIGYTRLLSLLLPSIEVITCWADDFEVRQHAWDKIVLDNVPPDPFWIMHGRPHPPAQRHDWEEPFHLNWSLDSLPHLEPVDEAPLWSQRLIEVCGGFNHSFTDAWTLMLEWFLWHNHKSTKTVFLPRPLIHRNVRLWTDLMASPRSQTTRQQNFNEILSPCYLQAVAQQAANVCRARYDREPVPNLCEQAERTFSPAAFIRQATERTVYEKPLLRSLARLLRGKREG